MGLRGHGEERRRKALMAEEREMRSDRVLNARNDYTLQGDWLSCHIAPFASNHPISF